MGEVDEAIDMRERQWPEQHAVHHAEQRRVRPYAQRQCGKDNGGKAGSLADMPGGVSNVLSKAGHAMLRERRVGARAE